MLFTQALGSNEAMVEELLCRHLGEFKQENDPGKCQVRGGGSMTIASSLEE